MLEFLLALHRFQYGYFELPDFVEFLSTNLYIFWSGIQSIQSFGYFPILHTKFR